MFLELRTRGRVPGVKVIGGDSNRAGLHELYNLLVPNPRKRRRETYSTTQIINQIIRVFDTHT